jgi:tetratricopeptide (TPR) repeat protein
VGTIAGIGGISLGIVLLIFKDFVRNFIQAKVFKTLSSEQATLLMGATIVFTFSIAIVGIFAGFVKDGGAVSFILLVVVLLVFIVAILYIVTRQAYSGGEQTELEITNRFFKVYTLLESSKIDDAEKELDRATNIERNSADYWYWKSVIAFARNNIRVASAYLDKAFERDPRHAHSLALKIKLLLLGVGKNDKAKAKELTQNSYGISDSLDDWLDCLITENMFSPGPRTNHELDLHCPFPKYEWN